MLGPTRSNVERNGRATWAVLLGLLAVLAIPAAVAAAERLGAFSLLQAGAAVPVAFVCAVAAILLARKAQLRTFRSIGRVGGERAARWGLRLGVLGLCLAIAGALSLGFYWLFDFLES